MLNSRCFSLAALGIALLSVSVLVPGPFTASASSRSFSALLRSRAVRVVLSETEEGHALAREIIGRPAQRDADIERLAFELARPEWAELAARLEPRLARIAVSRVRSVRSFRELASRELDFVRAVPGASSLDDASGAAATGLAARARGFLGESLRGKAAPSAAPRLKVAAVQYPVAGGSSLDEVRARMTDYVVRAKGDGAGLVVFPELFVLDRIDPASALSEADQLAAVARIETPEYFAHVARLSRELDIAVMGGTYPRELPEAAGGGIVNTAILAFPDGRVVFQDKLHLTPDEVAWGWKAGEELRVFDAPWGRAAILICYDSQFPSITTALARSAPETILVPSMTGAKGFHRVRWASQARAIEHHAFVVVTGTVDGPGGAFGLVAQAAILSPQDRLFSGLIRQGPKGKDALVYADLNLERLRFSRKAAGIYAGRDQTLRPTPIRVVAPDGPPPARNYRPLR